MKIIQAVRGPAKLQRLAAATAIVIAVVAGALSPTASAQGEEACARSISDACAPGQERFATNNGVRIHYTVAGDGPLVVLIHGFPDYAATWDELIPVLRDNYRVAAVDLRGYNLSDQPVNLADYSMDKLIGDILAVIDAEGRTSATLIGHDWGGAIAWRFAFAMPEKVDDLIVLSMPHPRAFANDLKANPKQYAANAYARGFLKPGSEAGWTPELLASWVSDPDLRAHYVEVFKRSSIQAMMNYFRANYPPGEAIKGLDPSAMVINLPLLVIHGAEDNFILPSGQDGTWAFVSSDSAMLMVPGAGHFVHHDAPDVVNQAIRSWLDLHRK